VPLNPSVFSALAVILKTQTHCWTRGPQSAQEFDDPLRIPMVCPCISKPIEVVTWTCRSSTDEVGKGIDSKPSRFRYRYDSPWCGYTSRKAQPISPSPPANLPVCQIFLPRVCGGIFPYGLDFFASGVPPVVGASASNAVRSFVIAHAQQNAIHQLFESHHSSLAHSDFGLG